MFAKCLILAAIVAFARAGYLAAPAAYAAPAYAGVVAPAIGTSQQSTLRSWDGSSAISQYSKAVDSAFSSVRKSDVRITNDAKYLTPAYSYAAPAAYAAPVAYGAHSAYAAPIARAGLVGVAYSAAPTVAHISYDSPISHYAW